MLPPNSIATPPLGRDDFSEGRRPGSSAAAVGADTERGAKLKKLHVSDTLIAYHAEPQ